MSDNPLLKKLLVKSGSRLLVLNAPANYLDRLQPLPEGVTISEQPAEGQFEVVQVFVKSREEVESHSQGAIQAVKSQGALWFTYPKGTSKIKTDINRDRGWDSLRAAGWDTVTQIAIDEDWSALRFKPASEINYRPGSSRHPGA